ncbi:MAG: DNA-3-methyladenine glycosylase I [Pyrinomonadaceae bacterium]|jgi:DNA-3-methyladenine glycosylase I|nr:DNA-3-methyladenine glycosylase I [Pyrinomonadaceae bacterium]
MLKRCAWPRTDLAIAYHDREWGVPLHDDRGLFEFLILEGAQAGLSWETVLQKRDNYRAAFDNFDAAKVAKYSPRKVQQLLDNAGIIRNRLKITSAIQNANAFIAVQRELGSFDEHLWRFVDKRPLKRKRGATVPARTPLSDTLSKDLAKRGFNFVGSTICYAFMQAVGLINDHDLRCFRYREIDNAREGEG